MTDEDAMTEIGWVTRETLAMIRDGVSEDSVRWRTMLDRKRALLAYVAKVA